MFPRLPGQFGEGHARPYFPGMCGRAHLSSDASEIKLAFSIRGVGPPQHRAQLGCGAG
jgi:hypothetical protein